MLVATLVCGPIELPADAPWTELDRVELVSLVDVPESLTPADEPGILELTGVARRIADCESGVRKADGTAVPGSYGTNLENTSGPGGTPISTASGWFHFLDGTWQWVNAEIGGEQYSRALHAPVHTQYEAFLWLYDEGRGAYHWNASRSCWQ